MAVSSRLAASLLTGALLLACHKSATSDAAPAASASGTPATAPSASAAPAATTGGSCDVVTCANFSGSPGYVAGHSDGVAADVPAAPGGSTLCGATTTFHANYYTTSQTPDQILAYYEKELPGHGFTVKPRKNGSRACSLELSFKKPGLQIGNVFAFVGGYSVSYFGN